MNENMIQDEVYSVVREIMKLNGDDIVVKKLKDEALFAMLNANRKYYQEAIRAVDNMQMLLRLGVDLKVIDYDFYTQYKEETNKLARVLASLIKMNAKPR